MASAFKPARTLNQLKHEVKTKVTDYLPNKEKYSFVDLFPEIVDQITVFDPLVEIEGGMAAKLDLFHKLPNVKTVILPDPEFMQGFYPELERKPVHPEGFQMVKKAILSGSNPCITSFVDSKGGLFMGGTSFLPIYPQLMIEGGSFEEGVFEYIANVRKQNPEYDGSDVRNLFTAPEAFELVRRNPEIKIKLYVSNDVFANTLNLLADERIRNRTGCLNVEIARSMPGQWTFESVTFLILGLTLDSTHLMERVSPLLKRLPNMTRLRLDLKEFHLHPMTDFISSLDTLKYLELVFMNMSDSSKSLVEFMLNPPRNRNLERFAVQSCYDDDSSWIVPSLQLDIKPGFKLLKLIGLQGRFVMKNRKIIIENLEPRLTDIFNKFSHVKFIDVIRGRRATDEYRRQVLADLEVIRSTLPRHRAVTVNTISN